MYCLLHTPRLQQRKLLLWVFAAAAVCDNPLDFAFRHHNPLRDPDSAYLTSLDEPPGRERGDTESLGCLDNRCQSICHSCLFLLDAATFCLTPSARRTILIMLAACTSIPSSGDYAVPRKRRQGFPYVAHRSIFLPDPFNQARGLNKPKEWFWKGLERFANTSDSMDDYQALAKAWPSFWPLPIEDGDGRNLAWHAEAHDLFLFYRNTLRGFWTRDPVALKDGFRVAALFGTLGDANPVFVDSLASCEPFQNAVSALKYSYPGVRPPNMQPIAMFWPNWITGIVEFVSHTDFQGAVWSLFRESWRARVCLSCSTYFFAEKAPQLYCSVACSNSAHQSSALKWWREKGTQRRAAQAKATRKPSDKRSGRRKEQ
jgi:hypothetical protein